ncbi:MAG: outer membrane protein transport protein [Candidatus Eisenbacteria bacterium]
MRNILFGTVSVLAAAGAAFGAGHPYTELELPVAELTGSHARALGMGGAHIAVAEDASALLWNPAGLVNVRRIELSTTIARGDREVETVWHGSGADRGTFENQIGSLHFLYPFPTYRGSLVIGFGVDRLQDYTTRYERSGQDGDIEFPDDSNGSALLTDTHLRDGKLSAYTGAVGWDVTARLSLGVGLSYLRGDLYDEQSFKTEDLFGTSPVYASYEDFYLWDATVTGWTGSLGILYKASPRVRFGGVLGAPRYLSLDSYRRLQLRDRLDDGSPSVDPGDPVITNDKITYPWWIGFGLSYSIQGLILAADIRQTDWQKLESEVDGEEFYYRPYYRDGTSFAVGAETLLPWFPLRFRGGYRYDPAPFQLTYIPNESALTVENGRDPSEIDISIDRERQYFSLGAGYLFDQVLAVDFTWQTGSYERVTEDPVNAPYSEERKMNDYLLSVGYRF